MAQPIDLTGLKFGRLTAIELCEERNKWGIRLWRWRCDCGVIIDRMSQAITDGRQVSCGCNRIEKAKAKAKHGMHATRTYRAWAEMKGRVRGKDQVSIKHYVNRGISIHEPWLNSFENFFADVGECPEGKSLDRYPDNNGNYEPNNVRWANQSQQMANTRRTVYVAVDGENVCLKHACKTKGINYDRTRSRIRLGMTPQKAFDTEKVVRRNGSKNALGHAVSKKTRNLISAKLKGHKRSPESIAKQRATCAAKRAVAAEVNTK